MYYYKKIRDLREDNDLTQQQVADILGIKREQYRRYETGMREIPAHHIIQLCKLYKVSSDYILELTDETNLNK